ncbi:MAG: hypothetical protein IIA14_05180 [SAR324 cluster bacterium]|nr:hypothetical protein [SAR324 cluster bacterium]
MTISGKRVRLNAIYELKGDDLRIAVFGRSQTRRPGSFDATKVRKDSGPLVVYELKRRQVSKPGEKKPTKKPALRARVVKVDRRNGLVWINVGAAEISRSRKGRRPKKTGLIQGGR